MGQPVLFLYMYKAKDSYWEFSDEEKEETGKRIRESFQAVGGKQIVSANCEWSNPDYAGFGVQEFPSIEALQQHFADGHEIGYLKHIEETYIVGTRITPDEDDSSDSG